MPNNDEIFEQVRTALVDALGVDEEEVQPTSTLFGDLGAESIDMLDIVFRLEKAFDIKIPKGELMPEDIFTNAEFVQDGRVTAAGLAQLRQRLPYIDLDEFAANPVVKEFQNQFTVQDLCRFVASKLQAA